MEYIAFDARTHETLARIEVADGRKMREARIAHERGTLQRFLAACEPSSPVAGETIGNWYWIVDEIGAAAVVTCNASMWCRVPTAMGTQVHNTL